MFSIKLRKSGSGDYVDATIVVDHIGSESLGLLNREECESLLEGLVRSTEDLVHCLYGEWIEINSLIDNLDKGD